MIEPKAKEHGFTVDEIVRITTLVKFRISPHHVAAVLAAAAQVEAERR